MTQQEAAEPLTGTAPLDHRVDPDPAQVPHRLLTLGRYPDRGQLPGPVQPGEPAGVPLVGLDPIAWGGGDQRRGDDLTVDTHRGEQPHQPVAGRPRLVTHLERGRIEPAHQPANRGLVVKDLVVQAVA